MKSPSVTLTLTLLTPLFVSPRAAVACLPCAPVVRPAIFGAGFAENLLALFLPILAFALTGFFLYRWENAPGVWEKQ